MDNPYGPVDQSGVIIEELNIGSVIGEIQDKGFCVVEEFLHPKVVQSIRDAFNQHVPITEMRAVDYQHRRTQRRGAGF